MAKEIIIDSYIGPGYYSKQYIRAMLKNVTNPTIKLSSLGGDFNHAIDMHDQIAAHGNVTIELTGFNASSSTILAIAGAKIRMSENSFFLIHKVMSWIDKWGYMNEDELQALIDGLEKEKDENAKLTLTLAKMYVKKTGKEISEILALMKKETWLTAEEALEWGFIDEIFNPAQKVNHLNNYKMVALLNAAGLPIPERKSQNSNTMDKTNELPKDEKSLMDAIAEFFGISPKEKSNESDDPKDLKIAELEKENTALKAKQPEKEDKVEKTTNDPKDLKIAELEKENAALKAKQPEKEDKAEKITNDPKDLKIAKLEKENATLKTTVVQDDDTASNSDNPKSTTQNDFTAAVEGAKEVMDYLDQE